MSEFSVPSHIKWISAILPIQLEEIRFVEKTLCIHYPSNYITCVMRHNGAYVIPGAIDVPGRGISVLNHLLSLSRNKGRGNYVLDTFEAIRDRLPTLVIPFGADPFGNYFCFNFADTRSGEPAVVFWDHEKAFSSVKSSAICVCASINDFLMRLHNSISPGLDAELWRMAGWPIKKKKK
jgi:hypothetical protein